MNLPRLGVAALLLATACSARDTAGRRPTVSSEILVPVLDTTKATLALRGPDGRPYPVLRAAPSDSLTRAVRAALDSSFAQQVLRLDRLARNYVAARDTAGAARSEYITAPMYLLMSNEEGGFPRFGFWLQDSAGQRTLVRAGFVDLVVDRNSVETGDFEEIFSHELGHLILRALTGGLPAGPSRTMHLSVDVTDYPTAFDEGFAEHFQPLVRDATRNPYLHRIASGTVAGDLEAFWLSAADNDMRTEGVKQNAFIHAKPLPVALTGARGDAYRAFVEDEASTAFLPTQLRAAQAMMASEGVNATLFYRLVNDSSLAHHYRDASFYAPFLGTKPSAPDRAVSPFENAEMKLFAAIADARGASAERPPVIAVVNAWAKLFPDEARRVYNIVIETTWGATASRDVAAAMQRGAAAGRSGDLGSFRKNRPFRGLDSLIAQVTSGRRALDADLGSELWIANPGFRIGRAFWDAQRTEPLTLNLNAASAAELMTIAGVDLATARAILAARERRGWLRSVDDLRGSVPAALVVRLRGLQRDMARLGAFARD